MLGIPAPLKQSQIYTEVGVPRRASHYQKGRPPLRSGYSPIPERGWSKGNLNHRQDSKEVARSVGHKVGTDLQRTRKKEAV